MWMYEGISPSNLYVAIAVSMTGTAAPGTRNGVNGRSYSSVRENVSYA